MQEKQAANVIEKALTRREHAACNMCGCCCWSPFPTSWLEQTWGQLSLKEWPQASSATQAIRIGFKRLETGQLVIWQYACRMNANLMADGNLTD